MVEHVLRNDADPLMERNNRKGVGAGMLRHIMEDCQRVEKETAKRAEEKRLREASRQPDEDSDSDDEECEVQSKHRQNTFNGATLNRSSVQAMRINDVYIHIASKSGREVEFYKHFGFHMTRIERG